MAPTTITVEDVERFRTRDPRAQTLVRERQVIRDDTASTMAEAVYTVASERVALHLVSGGYTTAHNCPECKQDRPCFRALAAVDAEATERFIATCDAVWHATKLGAAR
jgi:hypothetical protein